MNKTAITASAPSPRIPDVLPARAKKSGVWYWIKWVLTPVASLRLTVALFALSMLLVFFGTLAQVDEGIWTVLHRYFRSLIAFIPLQIFVRFGQTFFHVSPTAQLSGTFPFPGGWLLGSALLLNVVTAHLVRFRMTWRRSGILILHSGLIILMLSELATGLFATEGRMTIAEGGSSNFVEDHRATELSFVDPSDPTKDDVIVIPDALLRKGGVIQNAALPFDVEVVRFMVNSAEPEPKKSDNNPATKGDGVKLTVAERPETSGVDSAIDFPAAYVTLRKKGTDDTLGTYLVSTWWSFFSWVPTAQRPQQVDVNGNRYDMSLRFKRRYEPFTLNLIEFRHDVYPGTDIPKNYSSKVRLVNAERGEDRLVDIYMNNPMRYGDGMPWWAFWNVWSMNDTLYQADFLKGGMKGTVLQVVRNPGWRLPYFSCVLIALGMLVHFGLKLYDFLNRELGK